MPHDRIHLSVVTPVYQGEAYLHELVRELQAVRTGFVERNLPVALSEAIFVDDGSIDGSSRVLDELQAENAWVRVIRLSRNYGQHPATMAGILHSSGDWVATLDEDLQHPPSRLPSLLAKAVFDGHDVVYGRAEGRVHASCFRDPCSWAVKSLLALLSGIPHVREFSSFRMLRGSVARAAAAAASQEAYFDVALCWFTTRVVSLRFLLKDRRRVDRRKSGYGLRSLLRHARRMLVSSDVKVLRLGALTGLLSLACSLALMAATIVSKLTDPGAIEVRGWASLTVGLLFFFGLTSLLHGISLEYMSIMLHHTQGKPTFFVVDRDRDRILRDWLQARGGDAAAPFD